MGDGVLLGHLHLREGGHLSLGDEDRVEAESRLASHLGTDPTMDRAGHDDVLTAEAGADAGVEASSAVFFSFQQSQEPLATDGLERVRRVYAGEASQSVNEQTGVIKNDIAQPLRVRLVQAMVHDLLQGVRLDLIDVRLQLPDLDPDPRQFVAELLQFALVAGDEGDLLQVYRPRASI